MDKKTHQVVALVPTLDTGHYYMLFSISGFASDHEI